MPSVPLPAVALLWPALLPWLVATALPLVLAWWAVRHAKRVGWAAIDLIERAARAARITRSGLPLPLTLVRMLLIAMAALAATRPFLGDGAPPRGERLVDGDPARRIELVTAGPMVDRSAVALRAAFEALARGRPQSFPTVERVAVSAAGRAADPSGLIVLTDGAMPAGEEAARLANAVRDGAGLVVCLGPESVAAPLVSRMSAWLTDLVGVSVAGSVSLEDEAIVAPEAAASDPVREPTELPGPRVNRAAELVLNGEPQSEPTVLARSATTGRPLLVEGAVGRGRVVVSAIPLVLPQAGDGQTPWSDLAAWPAFVPFIDRLLTRLLEPASDTTGSASRFVGRLAGVPLARPLLACGMVLAAIEMALSWRRARAAGLAFDAASIGGRCAVFAVLGGMLALWGGRPPVWSNQPPDPLPVAVVIDVSPSMGGASGRPASRLQQLIEAVVGEDDGRSVLDRLAGERPIVLHAAAESPRGLGRYPADVAAADLQSLAAVPPTADASRLGDAVLTLLDEQQEREENLAAVIVMSDGAITGGASWATVAQTAARRGVPLVVVPVGDDATASAGMPVGFRFAAAPAPAIGQPGELITIPVRGMASTRSSRPVPIRAEAAAAELAADRMPTASGYAYTCGAGFSLRIPRADEARAAALHDALTASTRTLTLTAGDGAERHAATVPIVVADDPIRVLLVDHAPRYEVRFLERLLANDRRYAVSTRLLAARDVDGLRAEATLPQSVTAWSEFDVVVLGDLPIATADKHAAAWATLAEAASREGVGIAWLPGRRWAEADAGLVSWLPAVPGISSSGLANPTVPRRLRLLAAGRATGWLAADRAGVVEASCSAPTFSSLPPVSIRPTGRVIAIAETETGADQQPAIVVSQTGRGMIVGHLCDTWRWQGEDASRGSGGHARHWLHLLPRLAERRQLARLMAATVAVRPLDPLVGETIRVDVMPTRPTTNLAGWILEVESSAGPPRRLAIGGGMAGAVATLQVEGLAAGLHRLRLMPPADAADRPPPTTIEHEIVVNERLVERVAGPAGTGALRVAVEAGGGAVVPLDRIETLPDTITTAIGGRQRGDRSPLWLASQTAAHLLLATLVSACAAAWWPRATPAPSGLSRS